jgi:hypothetical protein
MNMNCKGVDREPMEVDDSEELCSTNPIKALAELCVLLEEYAPSWYSDEQRNRVVCVLVELCVTLEDRSPLWYTEEKRNRALAALRVLGLLSSGANEAIC